MLFIWIVAEFHDHLNINAINNERKLINYLFS